MVGVTVGHLGAGSPVVRRHLLGAALAVSVLLGACSLDPDSGAASTSTTSHPCTVTGAVELDPLTFDVAPRTLVTLSGGTYRLMATGFLHGGPFDPAVGRTTLAWGPTSTPPTYDPGPATVPQRTGQLDLVEKVPTVVELSAGTFWFLNSNGVRVRLEACSPATASSTSPR
jgi:ABC-type Fe3+-hydroxamate transport system substrate-binding protein